MLSFGLGIAGIYSELDVPIAASNYEDQWVHIAATFDGTTKNIYRNGILIGTQAVSGSISTSGTAPVFIGSYSGSEEFFNGTIDEVRIWNRALNRDDIQANMSCELMVPQSHLVAYYKFNQGVSGISNPSIFTLFDSSGNSLHGKLMNFALSGANSNWSATGAIVSAEYCHPIYTFNGNGNWSDVANWMFNIKPPTSLPKGSFSFINPINGGECILDTIISILDGSELIIQSGKKFRILEGILISPNKVTVYTNIEDPRLAEMILNTGKRIVFFGERNSDGSPKVLTSYSIASQVDATKFDFITLDKEGRYNNIFLASGEKMHLEYRSEDSVQITLSDLDTVTNKMYARVASHKSEMKPSSSAQDSIHTHGLDKKVSVKITTKNTATGIEEEVAGNETLVIVNFNAGQEHNYYLQAQYDGNTKIYSVPLSMSGLDFHDEFALDKTISLINKALEFACSAASSSDPNIDKSITELIASSICPIPTPVANAICPAAGTVLIACKAQDIFDVLKKAESHSKELLYKIDPNSIPITDAIASASSKHYKYKVKFSEQKLVQIISNPYQYDFKIVHEFSAVDSNNGVFTDNRDGQQYPYKKIGSQVWMTRNLNYDTADGSWCFDCPTYGRLYDWGTAKRVIPAGWHLPSDEEWTTLTTFLGGDSAAGTKMKSIDLWAGLFGGARVLDGRFLAVRENGFWWSSTEASGAWIRDLYSGSSYSNRDDYPKGYGLSVRCIKD